MNIYALCPNFIIKMPALIISTLQNYDSSEVMMLNCVVLKF